MHQEKFKNRLRVGDIVLIKNPAKKRQHWKFGKVLELTPGSDGNVRIVKIFRGDENYKSNPQTVIHAIKHLYPLELAISHNHVADTSTMDIDLNNVTEVDESVEEDAMVDDSVNTELGYSYSEEVDSVTEAIEEQLQAYSLDSVFIPLDENTVAEVQTSSVDRPRRVTSRVKNLWTINLFFINKFVS